MNKTKSGMRLSEQKMYPHIVTIVGCFSAESCEQIGSINCIDEA